MSKNDYWFRSDEWSGDAQSVFYEKIRRSRSNFHRQQYARIKALSLIHTNKPEKLNAAVKLLNKSLSEWCETPSDKDEAYTTLGEAYRKLKEYEKAAAAYEKSITWNMNLIHRGYYDYPEMIVSEGMTDRFDRAIEIVNTMATKRESVLEFDKFLCHAVRAIVLNYQGDSLQAKKEAAEALSVTSIKRSTFAFHPKVGLVDTVKYKQLIKKLSAI